jgi:hypothetical protein
MPQLQNVALGQGFDMLLELVAVTDADGSGDRGEATGHAAETRTIFRA